MTYEYAKNLNPLAELGFAGVKIIVSLLAEHVERIQVRFPRSKRKRIQNKWRKQNKNFKETREPAAYWVNGMLICHPEIERQLRKSVQDREMIRSTKELITGPLIRGFHGV